MSGDLLDQLHRTKRPRRGGPPASSLEEML
jgi:hypothetical protein